MVKEYASELSHILKGLFLDFLNFVLVFIPFSRKEIYMSSF